MLTLLLVINYGQGGFKRNIVLPNSKAHFSLGVAESTPNNYVHVGLVVDTLNGYQTNRLCIMGLNQNGQVQWVKKYGNHKFMYLNYPLRTKWISKIDNFIYLATAVTDSNNVTQGVLLKINFNGDTVWQKKYFASAYNVTPYDICKTKDNGFLITGSVYDNADSKLLIIKTNSLGDELWRKTINKPTNNGPNYQIGHAIIQDSASKKILIGGVQFIGNTTWWTEYSNLVLTDSLGNFIVRKNYPINKAGSISCLKQIKDGSILASGGMSNLEFFNSYQLSYGYIVKFLFDDNLTVVYQKQNLDEKSVYNIYNNIVELDNGNLIFAGIQDTSFIKAKPFDLMGKILWTDKDGNFIKKRYYSTKDVNDNNGNSTALYSFFQTMDKGYIAGYYHQLLTMPGKFMVVKYDSTGCDSSSFYCATVGLKEQILTNSQINTYPQPAKELLNLQSTILNNQVVSATIVNNLGEVVLNKKIEFVNNQSGIVISNLTPGVYLLRLVTADYKTFTTKIIKE